MDIDLERKLTIAVLLIRICEWESAVCEHQKKDVILQVLNRRLRVQESSREKRGIWGARGCRDIYLVEC